jgi:hypothetical protein
MPPDREPIPPRIRTTVPPRCLPPRGQNALPALRAQARAHHDAVEQPACTPGDSPCLPPAPDYDCLGGTGDGPEYVSGPVRVSGFDPYGLDYKGDGIGCE